MPMAGSKHSAQKSLAKPLTCGARLIALMAACVAPALADEAPMRKFTISGDTIASSLTGAPGDPVAGRAIVLNRQVGLCILCHFGPFPDERFQGNLAPDMAGAGTRWSEGQLRLRIVDARRLNPDTIMPPYYSREGLTRVAPAFSGKPLLSAEQIEDVVAFLTTLRNQEQRP
jgi:sulfur-oxidizing protein SoxX